MTPPTDHICGPFDILYDGEVPGGNVSDAEHLLSFLTLYPNDRGRCRSCHKLYVVKDGRLEPCSAPPQENPQSETGGSMTPREGKPLSADGPIPLTPPIPNPVLPTFANAINDLMQAPVEDVATPISNAARLMANGKVMWLLAENGVGGEVVLVEVAQRLEKDLAARDAELAQVRVQLEDTKAQLATIVPLTNGDIRTVIKLSEAVSAERLASSERAAELARVTAERDEAIKARKEREAELGRLVKQMENDDDEYEAQLAQARSELETVKREFKAWKRVCQNDTHGYIEQIDLHRKWATEYKTEIGSLQKQLTAAQQTIERIGNEVDQYADGAPDATAHDRLANTILGMCPPVVAIAEVRGGQV